MISESSIIAAALPIDHGAWISQSAWVFAAPAIVFMLAAISWFAVRRGSWLARAALVLAYLGGALLLYLAGSQPIERVHLEGLELDLVDGSGKPRVLTIGGIDPNAGREPSIYVPSFPAEALQLTIGRDLQLAIKPGAGYERGLLVRSGATVIPVEAGEAGGLPRFEPLGDGARWRIGQSASGHSHVWVLGPASDQLTPTRGAVRWLGGGERRDSLEYVSEFPPEVVGLQEVGGRLQLTPGAGFHRGIRVYLDGAELALPAAIDYRAGATRLEIREGGSGSGLVTLAKKFGRTEVGFQPDGGASPTSWRLPNRLITVPLIQKEIEIFDHYNWSAQLYPLGQAVPGGEPMLSSLAINPRLSGAARFGMLVFDPGIVVEDSGKKISAGLVPSAGVLPSGANVDFLKLHRAPAEGGREWPGRIKLARSFGKWQLLQRPGRGGSVPYLSVEFAQPQVVPLRHPVPHGTVPGEDEDDGEAVADFALNDQLGFASGVQRVDFRFLTDSFAGASADGRFLGSGDGVRLRTDRGDRLANFGDEISIGGSDRLRLRFQRDGIPWRLIALELGVGFVILILGWRACGRFADSCLLFAVAFLTVARVLFCYEATVKYPYEPGILRDAVALLVIVPLCLLLVLRSGRSGLLHALARWLFARLERGLGYRGLTAVVVCLFVLRFGLLAVGFKEGVGVLGYRLALSTIFVPLHAILFSVACCRFFSNVHRGTPIHHALLAMGGFAAVFMGTQAVAGFMVSDLGTFLYLIPSALVMTALAIFSLLRPPGGNDVAPGAKGVALLWLGRLVAVAFIVPGIMISLFVAYPRKAVSIVPSIKAQLESDDEIATGSTMLRVLQFVDSDYLIQLGTNAAEEIAQDHATMENYSHRGLLGQGVMQTEIVASKSKIAMNDNVSAVFIFAQFGVLGAVGMMLVYGAVIAGSGLIAGDDRSSLASWLALLSGLLFGLPSIYMMAANYGILPFTGRNMYLLGLNSLSDPLEAMVLLGLVAVGIGQLQGPRQTAADA